MSLGLPNCLELNFRGLATLKRKIFPGEEPGPPHKNHLDTLPSYAPVPVYCNRTNFRTRFNFVYFILLAESTKFSSVRKPYTYTSVSDTTVAVRKFLGYESRQTLEYEIISRTKISAITVAQMLSRFNNCHAHFWSELKCVQRKGCHCHCGHNHILSLFSDRHVVSLYLNFRTCVMNVTLYVPCVDEVLASAPLHTQDTEIGLGALVWQPQPTFFFWVPWCDSRNRASQYQIEADRTRHYYNREGTVKS